MSGKITIAKQDSTPQGVTAAFVPGNTVAETVAAMPAEPTPPIEPIVHTEIKEVLDTPAPLSESDNVIEEPVKKEKATKTTVSFKGKIHEPAIANEVAEVPKPQEQPKPEDLLKNIPKDELYKYLGLDEHDIRFSEFRKKGGNPYELIEQKLIDWDKVPDVQLIKQDLAKQHPSLSNEKIEKLFASKYKQDEFSSDDDKEFGAILLEADAYTARQKRIEEQKRNEIPFTQQQVSNEPNQYEKIIAEENRKAKEIANHVITSNTVRELLSKKELKVDVGNGNFHTFDIDEPNHLVDVLLDDKVSSQYGIDAQGKPDTQLMLEMALFKANPQIYRQGLIEYGRSIALLDELLKDGQNATKPVGASPRPNGTIMNGNGQPRKITPTTNRVVPYGD